ncbi:GNAT family N-acetyltransferase [Paludisphaera mucosa]|uniref:GNAT family N-acetyltransferase n=1 Tax=Paludisphaera mucosa TaxID=3030827 RepID=A0ABT6FH13_9BACT|nr:GNAT family N-acetyltransferase [Paludisphaera mucosa]MDG3006814.1 GNAT family N-acetyltransferase [Paludisphaera mucosa]
MLDNVIWSALTTRQTHLALGGERARRYPADMAPFLGTVDASPESTAAMAELIEPGETLYVAGVAPDLPPGVTAERLPPIAQMVFVGRIAPPASDEGVAVLGPGDAPDMIDLMAEVYPGYFRPRTPEMGMYLGVRQGGLLVAMAGQRMCLDGHREISGVATRPEARGKGHASRLVALLVGAILREGLTPFLHVDADNAVARSAYENAGFVRRRDVEFFRVRRDLAP